MRVSVFLLFIFLSGASWAGDFRVEFDGSASAFTVFRGQNQQKISVKLPEGFSSTHLPPTRHEPVKAVESGSMAILVLPLTDGEAGTTVIYAISNDGKLLWDYDFATFNVATPLVDKSFVYLGGIGVVAKLNKKDGKIVWHHGGLYENPSVQYEGAKPITRAGVKIRFAANLEVDDKTGAITKVFD